MDASRPVEEEGAWDYGTSLVVPPDWKTQPNRTVVWPKQVRRGRDTPRQGDTLKGRGRTTGIPGHPQVGPVVVVPVLGLGTVVKGGGGGHVPGLQPQREVPLSLVYSRLIVHTAPLGPGLGTLLTCHRSSLTLGVSP